MFCRAPGDPDYPYHDELPTQLEGGAHYSTDFRYHQNPHHDWVESEEYAADRQSRSTYRRHCIEKQASEASPLLSRDFQTLH